MCCIDEHTQSKDQILGCNFYIQYNITRGQRNSSEECKEAMRKRRKQSSVRSDRLTPEVTRTKGTRDADKLSREARRMKEARAARSNTVRHRMRR
jgi:hypothetical protein